MLHSSSKRSARPPSPSKYPSEPPPPLRPPPPLAVGVDAALPPLLPPRQGTGTEKLNPHERIERERERGGENGGERMLCQEFGDEVPSTQTRRSDDDGQHRAAALDFCRSWQKPPPPLASPSPAPAPPRHAPAPPPSQISWTGSRFSDSQHRP
ncbi:hypothetical protein MPTK1_2g24390 [Marchantia polymorpha subsp. ruderalis]|uniref:Uncharacterized protein n=1 Tax=Marchantia polymorpha TaxID=3197 RepID=A0A2R6WPH4_MARPO|nr:hypothetical protein MARPO_0069s0087 [Marchantia polymorpha]BBN03550.1 hypothetical protein Mp_2g24390 [Marchantia polymorpha subsp. ruderalis]|eukprot:PTQ35755.1 hypothetical protein MARPO_0069s0087 [Marchantia polymorpha]